MPYLRITCSELPPARRREIAQRLTDEINDLFYTPRAAVSREELREHTTVHFTPYRQDEMFIGARTPRERDGIDLTVEVSDWSMSEGQQRKIAKRLTPVLVELFDIKLENFGGINIRFHPYPPKDFAVGGRLLSDVVPLIGRVLKRLL